MSRMSQERSARQVLLAIPTGKQHRNRPRTTENVYISNLAWSCIDFEPEELSDRVAEKRVEFYNKQQKTKWDMYQMWMASSYCANVQWNLATHKKQGGMEGQVSRTQQWHKVQFSGHTIRQGDVFRNIADLVKTSCSLNRLLQRMRRCEVIQGCYVLKCQCLNASIDLEENLTILIFDYLSQENS